MPHAVSDYIRDKIVSRRAFVLGGLQLAGFSVLVSRLWYLQVMQSDKYQVLAEENRISTRLIAPNRGQIFDRRGQAIATNVQNFQVTLVPEQVDDIKKLLTRFNDIIPLEESEIKRIERELKRHSAFAPVLLHDNLSWEQVAALELHAPELPGLSIEAGEVRNYPFAEATAHILGYVGAVTDKERTGDPLLNLPGFRIGKGGVEKQHEGALRGIAGRRQLEVNAHGRIVRELDSIPPTSGHEVTLTIDMGLQQIMQAKLAEQTSAAAVIMDVNTGAIHALGSHPSFDPNLFTFGINQQDWSRLNTDERTPLHNKAINGVYAPGSTFKLVTALAALESGMVTNDFHVNCPGHMELGDHTFHCWKKGGHGSVNMVDALAGSCDVYFYEVGRRIGINRIQAMAELLGLGKKVPIDMPGARGGLVPTTTWKQTALRQPWQQGETLIAAIGQGYVTASPLQLAIMTARIANGGFAVEPHITHEVDGLYTERTTWPELGIKKKNLEIVQAGMNAVVNRAGATAYASRIQEPGMEMAGKTGTSQVRRISKAERLSGVIPNEKLPWKERDHALFVAFAPVEKPRFAISVIVEHGMGGSKVAAPIARDLLIETQKRIT